MTATEHTRARIAHEAASLPFADEQDYEDARRGFVARSEQRRVTASDGRTVWDLDAYAFLDAEPPATASPSLWRQSRLLVEDGLFEVAEGIYQLRGYDLSVMTVIEGGSGIIVVDPLISVETAAAALALYREHRGERSVVAVIYTHSHVDHFGGVLGVIDEAQASSGAVQVIAPAGFMEHAISENVMAGTAMTRRAGYMYGAALAKGPDGQIGAGLGQTTSTGTVSLVPPNVEVGRTGEELLVDGVRLVFQITPGTEAPAEFNFYLPDRHALCMAENATHTLHNILTLRGAEVRDARGWADYITEAIDLFGADLDVVFASHHWPTWGRERAVEYLSLQRDLYSYLHDQTVRLMNRGFVGAEIAEMFQLPPALEQSWHTRGYYGSVSHNTKAIYQRYMGWYDGNPAHLWQHPPVEAARRYVEAFGGPDAAVALGQRAYDDGDYRWAAEVLDRVVFAAPDRDDAKALLADTLEQLGFASENGTWRSAFLAGAHELRHGVFGTPVSSSGLASALTVQQVFLSAAVKVDGPRSWDVRASVAWVFTDLDLIYLTELRNGTLVHRAVAAAPAGTTTLTLTRPALLGLVAGAVALSDAVAAGTVALDGDPADIAALFAALSPDDPDFPIVTPRATT
jgi:alkyl sulfatase BDS1-like metallo-beta-lactamase superfamily hydrolase